ncbi:hypothetical protein [Halomicrobium urmianum]|uniref:hypothetical protein n=1 Tax=Halomicrobium urmianum TaxID=1586233 RepID=UPI001CDA2315|nr:hypothetical protein [Halomicrobium urmianum]
MTLVTPEPPDGAAPYNDPISRRLDPGEKLTVTFSPKQRVTEFTLPILAISKYRNSSYEVWMDEEPVYGPAPIPPTDVDDMTPTFIPARTFQSRMKIIVRNLDDSTTRRYSIQPIGWEVTE